MRGQTDQRQSMFCYISPEGFVPKGHPLRPLKKMVDAALEKLSPKFDEIYSHTGRPSIPPEKLFKASLLQAFYSIRSERQLVEQGFRGHDTKLLPFGAAKIDYTPPGAYGIRPR